MWPGWPSPGQQLQGPPLLLTSQPTGSSQPWCPDLVLIKDKVLHSGTVAIPYKKKLIRLAWNVIRGFWALLKVPHLPLALNVILSAGILCCAKQLSVLSCILSTSLREGDKLRTWVVLKKDGESDSNRTKKSSFQSAEASIMYCGCIHYTHIRCSVLTLLLRLSTKWVIRKGHFHKSETTASISLLYNFEEIDTKNQSK